MLVMKTLYLNLRLVFSGDTVLVVISTWLFLASLANTTHWRMLQSFRFCGICTLLLSTTFCLLTGIELFKEERTNRTIVAGILLLAAVVMCFSNGHFTIQRG
jgi:hypothetical protein